MKKTKQICLLLTAAMTLSMLSGCGSKTGEADADQTSAQVTEQSTGESAEQSESEYAFDTFKLAGGSDCGGPNPYKSTWRGDSRQRFNIVFDSLMDSGTEGRIPMLAKEYTQDGNKFTFILNENARWHDGKKLTADDVAFTVEYYKKNPPTPPVAGGLYEGEDFIIENVTVVDEETVEITVNDIMPDTFARITTFHVLPKHIWENVEDPMTYDGDDQYVGSGAFKLKSYDSATGTYEYEAMENYYRGTPIARRIVYVPVSDELLAFDNGDIDMVSVPIDLLENYKQQDGIGIMTCENSGGTRMHINMEKLPQFKDVEMRRALYYAIDRERIVSDINRGSGEVASAGFCPTTSPWYNPEVEKYDYDIEKAKAAFAGKDLSLTISCAESLVKTAELVKMDLEAAGIKTSVRSLDAQTADTVKESGDYELMLVNTGGWGLEPFVLAELLTNNTTEGDVAYANVDGWSNDNIQAIIDELHDEADESKRKELYRELQLEASKDVPVLFLATYSSYTAYHKDVYDDWKQPYDSQQFMHYRINYIQGVK